MTETGSYPERLLLVIALCGAPSIVPPQRHVNVRSVTTQLDNYPLFL
jgi:hypothetical protein